VDRTAQFYRRPVARVLATIALLLSVGAVPAVHPFASSATPASPATARAASPTGCNLGPNGAVKHVIFIEFDNTHFMRDPARNGSRNVPSDLEQMPNLLNFLKGNGTVLTNYHMPLISHTSDDITSSESGLYPGNNGVANSANSYYEYTSPGSPARQTGFTYWTSKTKDGAYNFLGANGQNAPAPWVPYTRAGCNVGGVAMSGLAFENSTDVNQTFGMSSTQATDPNQFADYYGVAVHCAATDPLCSNANGGAPDVLPNEPGGYNGYNALYGHRSITQALTTTGQISSTAVLTDTNGNPIVDDFKGSITNGFPGFSIAPQYSLGYVADLQEHGVPVTYAYIITPHRPLSANPYGYGFPTDTNDYGPGEAHYVAQLKQYDQAFGAFFQRLNNDGINKSNTEFVFTTDEGDHFIGETPSPANCDGVSVACTYPQTPPATTPGITTSLGELTLNFNGLLQGETGISTPVTINNDDAPDFYLNNQPGPTDSTARAFERGTAALTVTNPLSTALGISSTENLAQYQADPAEFRILHMLTADPLRTPTFVTFAQPDYYVQSGSCNGAPVSITCVTQNPGYNWNHGDVQPEITTGWLGLVGPGVQQNGIDAATFADHTDTRPTMLSLLGLADDYTDDGRVLTEDLFNVPPAVQADRNTYEALARTFKALNAPVGPFGLATLVTSTQALASGSASDDSTYTADEAQLTSLGQQRDNLTGQMQTILASAAFTPTYQIPEAQAQSLIAQGQALLSQVTGAPAVASPSSTPIQHVLLISVDGFHAADLQNYIAMSPTSALAQLATAGVIYPNASTSRPSDSFPGLLSMVTGGTPKSTGVYYDDAYDRSYLAPGTTNCVTDTPPMSGTGPVSGTEVQFAENIDRDPTRTDAGGGIDPSKLPVDPSNCQPVYPHQYLRVNTIFNAIHNAGGRTAWSDKHPAYDLVNGHQGGGVDDLYTPEINGAITVTPGTLQYSNITVATTTTYSAATAAVTGTVAYDNLKVRAILNEINGTGSITPTQAYSVPEIFGMNFQAVSVGQKSPNGGYSSALATPTGDLVPALDYVNNAIGAMVSQLQAQGLYTSTLVIVTAKHGQAPIDRSTLQRIGHAVGNVLSSANISVAQLTDDDVALVWLRDRSQTAAAVQALQNMSATIGISNNNQIISGTQLAQQFGNAAYGHGDPSLDPRLPDIIVTPNQGVIYTNSTKKISEHGGFNHDDTNVALLVSNPQLAQAGTLNLTPVSTTQIAPSILSLLGLNPDALQSVQEEGTQPLPGLTISSTNPLTPTGTPTVSATASTTTGAGTATSTSGTATATTGAGTATTTAVPATATSTASPTNTPTNTATNTPTNTNTATNTPTNTPVAPAPTSTRTPVATTGPVNTPAPTATPYPTIVVTPPSGTGTPTPRPTPRGCNVAFLVLKGTSGHPARPALAVNNLRNVRGEGSAAVSRTPLFFADGRGVTFHSTRSYRVLICGVVTLVDVQGTIHDGSATVGSRRHAIHINLRGASFELRVKRDPQRGHPRRGHVPPPTYNVQVRISGPNRAHRYSLYLAYAGLRGSFDIHR